MSHTVITRKNVHLIVNDAAISVSGSQQVSYRSDATVTEYPTEAEMLAAHQAQFPEQYEDQS